MRCPCTGRVACSVVSLHPVAVSPAGTRAVCSAELFHMGAAMHPLPKGKTCPQHSSSGKGTKAEVCPGPWDWPPLPAQKRVVPIRSMWGWGAACAAPVLWKYRAAQALGAACPASFTSDDVTPTQNPGMKQLLFIMCSAVAAESPRQGPGPHCARRCTNTGHTDNPCPLALTIQVIK